MSDDPRQKPGVFTRRSLIGAVTAMGQR